VHAKHVQVLKELLTLLRIHRGRDASMEVIAFDEEEHHVNITFDTCI